MQISKRPSLARIRATALMAAAVALAIAPVGAASAPQDVWQRLEFPPVPVPWGLSGEATVLLQPDAEGANMPAKGELRVRMHRNPQPTSFVDLEPAAATLSGRHLNWDLIHVFPWGESPLTESWLELWAGKHEHEPVLPSSLFRYTHGLAEPHHPARQR